MIVPWAASVVMTSVVFYYGFDPFYGVINRASSTCTCSTSPTGSRSTGAGVPVAMGVAVFVSLPFTTYTILAGLQTIPRGRAGGGQGRRRRPVRRLLLVVLPILRPPSRSRRSSTSSTCSTRCRSCARITGSIPGLRRRHHHHPDLQVDPERPAGRHGQCAQRGQLRDRAPGDPGLPADRATDARRTERPCPPLPAPPRRTPAASPVPRRRLVGIPRAAVRARWLLSLAGAVVALLFLLPYLVMIIGSFKPRAGDPRACRRPTCPSSGTRTTTSTLWCTPETPLPLQPGQHAGHLGVRDAAGAGRGHPGRLLHRAAPVPGPLGASCCSCWSPRCCSRRCWPPGCSGSSWRSASTTPGSR